MTITVDISAQVRELRKQIERATQAIINADDRDAVATRLAVGSPIDRMVAEYYRKIQQERAMKKVKITHDGIGSAAYGSITDAETGEEVKGVSRAEIVLDAREAAPRAVLYIDPVALDFTVDAACVSTVSYDREDIDSIDKAIAHLQAERAERMQL